MAKVLLVEDDNSLREIFEMRLKAEGYDTVTAADGEEGLVVATKEKPDLIVADVMMPKLSGFEMLETLHDVPEMQGVKVIMMTALGQAEDRIKGEKLGVVKYLVKSQVTLEDFIKAIGEVLPVGGGAAKAAVPVENSDQPTPAEMTGMTAAASSDQLNKAENNQESESTMDPQSTMPTSTPAPEPTMQTAPVEMASPAPATDAPAGMAAPAMPMDASTPAPAADMSATPAMDAPVAAPSTVVTPTEPTADNSVMGSQPSMADEKSAMDAQVNAAMAAPAPVDMSAQAAPAPADASAPAPAPTTDGTVSQPSEGQSDPSSMAL